MPTAQFVTQPAGNSFSQERIHVKTDKQFRALEDKLRKEDNNLLMIVGKNANEQWLNDIAMTSGASHRRLIPATSHHNLE